jgi:hypothetical protein
MVKSLGGRLDMERMLAKRTGGTSGSTLSNIINSFEALPDLLAGFTVNVDLKTIPLFSPQL